MDPFHDAFDEWLDGYPCYSAEAQMLSSFYEEEFNKREYYSLSQLERIRVSDWTSRVLAECKSNSENCVITLTYNPEHLPQGGNLCVSDVQKYFKRFRKLYPLRYFGCGEYGSKGMRPHYHIVHFGYCPNDLVFSHSKNGIDYYRSEEVARFWSLREWQDLPNGKHKEVISPIGFVCVCPMVSEKVIPYTCKYLQKFNNTPKGLKKPFMLCSRNPGIGWCAVDNGALDLVTDKLYYAGKSRRIPRYYLRKLKSEWYHRAFVDCEVYRWKWEDIPRFVNGNPINVLLSKRREYWKNHVSIDPQYQLKVNKFWQKMHERK